MTGAMETKLEDVVWRECETELGYHARASCSKI